MPSGYLSPQQIASISSSKAGDNPPLPGGLPWDFGGSEIRSGDGSNGKRASDSGIHNSVEGSNNVNEPTINFRGPQFIVNSDGKSLDLAMSDTKSVASHPFHGGLNQQWHIQDDGNGAVALLSTYNWTFVTLNPDSDRDPELLSANVPFYWEISKNGGGYQLAVPNSDLVLSLGNSPMLRPLSDAQDTRLFILKNTLENQAAITGGKFVPSTVPKDTDNASTGPTINLTINGLSGLGNAANTLKDLQHFIMSASIPSLPSSSDFNLSLTGRECSGFPAGFFRIRAKETQYYLSLHNWESSLEGNALCLWSLRENEATQVFYLNTRGELCVGGGYVDVMGNTLIIAHNRAPTLPWPNPWSHLLPTFSYSKDSKSINVTFYADPLVSGHYRPEKEWKDTEFLIAAQPTTVIKVPHIHDITRWAPSSRFIRWTSRADSWQANAWNGVAVEEYKIAKSGDAKRIQWELELV